MKKVIVIGCPGSGKSTFARKLRDATDLPLYHLDMMYWNKDKTTVPREVFIKRLREAMEKPEWIIDGNYASTMEMRFEACDTVFFLDYPTDVCLSGIEERQGQPRSDMPWIEENNRDEEFIEFIRQYNKENRPQVVALIKKDPSKDVKTFRSRKDADEYLKIL